MASQDAPAPDIMNVKEIIEFAFGDFEKNAVNFKLVQTVLYLLARQLRLLERRVIVEMGPLTILPSESSLTVTEVKIHASQKTKSKKTLDAKSGVDAGTDAAAKGKKTGRGRKYTYSDKTSSDKTSTDKTSTDKTSTDKTSTDKSSTAKRTTYKTPTDKTYTKKTFSDKTPTDKTYTDTTSTDKTSSDKAATDKTSTYKTSTDKTSTYKTSTDETSTYKTSTDETSTYKTSTDETSTDKTSSDKTATDKTSTDKTSTDKTSTDKTTSDKTSTDKTSSDKTATDKTSTDKTSTNKTTSDKTSTDKTSSDKTATDKTSTDKTSTDKTSTDKTSSDKTATDKTSTDKTSTAKTSTNKTTTVKTSTAKTATEKTSTDESSTAKTSTDKTSTAKSSSDKTSSDKASTAKSSSDKTSSDKASSADKTTSSTDKPTSSTEKTTTDRTTSSTEKSTTDKTTSSIDKTSTEKRTSTDEMISTDKTISSAEMISTEKRTSTDEKIPTDKTTSSAEKTITDKTTSSDKSSSPSTTSTSIDKPASKTSSSVRLSMSRTSSTTRDAAGRQKPDHFRDNLNASEEQRERELRVIHQRTDSFEETLKTPTPMASISSLQYEKLLVVQKVPSSEARLRESVRGARPTPRISVVTQEQFNKVADAVRELEKKLLPVATPGFLENAELMQELRKGASLTDAMAALQLSARLEATEKTLGSLISMVTDLALQTPGVELDSETRAFLGIPETAQLDRDRVISEKREHFEGDPSTADTKTGMISTGGKAPKSKGAKGGKTEPPSQSEFDFVMPEIAETEMPEARSPDTVTGSAATELGPSRFITQPDLHLRTKEMYDEMIKKVKTITERTTIAADTAYKMSMKLEAKLNAALVESARMDDLENAVRKYAEQINSLDTGLTSQMTNYQEQLTQMQHDLEIGLDTMAEVYANSGGDNEAVSELHSRFATLQMDFEVMSFRQKELKGAHSSIAYDLENLWREIEMLRDTKSDREEVTDALRDKVGIRELNGLVSLQQFEAVRGDFQKRIRAAYDKFNNQELIWQKAIDDMVKMLNEKADLVQVHSLKDEIQKYLIGIKERMQIISDIVGEPKSAMLSKKVFRDTICLSCGTPAHMDVEEPGKVPALPKFPSAKQPAEGAKADSETKGSGDYGICYPNLPIPHPRDPRSHICRRYCGGSHTVVTDGLNRTLPGVVVQQVTRTSNATPGTDGKLYLTDEETKRVPCLACNKLQPSSIAPEPEPQKQDPSDTIDEFGNISLTPPAHEISYN